MEADPTKKSKLASPEGNGTALGEIDYCKN
jgi:hypothetical protein